MKIAITFSVTDRERRAIAAHLVVELRRKPARMKGNKVPDSYDGHTMATHSECKRFLDAEGMLGVERVVGEYAYMIGEE